VRVLPGKKSIAFYKQGEITPSFTKSNTREEKAKERA